MFSRILVAHRGEIAVRAVRAAYRTVTGTLDGRKRATAVRERSVSAAVAPAEKADPGDPGHVAAPFQGTVTVFAEEGREVAAGETVASIEAMKMEAAITAPRAGTVSRLVVTGTQPVEGGDLVLELG